jgi:hypothetical protein
MHPTRMTTALIAASAAVALAPPAPAAAIPAAHAARSCTPPKYPGLGYFTSLSVSGTSCSEGGKLAIDYYHCRLKHGKTGTCHSTILGYNCREKRQSIPTEIDARVTCTRGHATVTHSYQQDT